MTFDPAAFDYEHEHQRFHRRHFDKTPLAPLRKNLVLHWIGRGWLRLGGWKITGHVPNSKRLVAVVGPHTSNWDFLWGIGVIFQLETQFSFLIKKSVFVPVVGPILRWLGGVPVDRSAPQDLAKQVTSNFEAEGDGGFIIAITPEGTRSNKKKLKTGFYRILKAADTDFITVHLDYDRRIIHLSEPWNTDVSLEEMVAQLNTFFAPIKGKYGYWMDRPGPDSIEGVGQ